MDLEGETNIIKYNSYLRVQILYLMMLMKMKT